MLGDLLSAGADISKPESGRRLVLACPGKQQYAPEYPIFLNGLVDRLVKCGLAFPGCKLQVECTIAGRLGYLAGRMPRRDDAQPSSPTEGVPTALAGVSWWRS